MPFVTAPELLMDRQALAEHLADTMKAAVARRRRVQVSQAGRVSLETGNVYVRGEMAELAYPSR